MPSELHRKIRPIKQAHFWKGSDSVPFLHYAGFIVLKPHLPDREYRHYMLLFCAVTLLSSSVYREKWGFAGELLNKFVEDFGIISVYFPLPYTSIRVCCDAHTFSRI